MLFRIFYADFSRFNHEITRFLLFIRSYLVLNPSISCARARSLSPCASALHQSYLLFARHPRAFPWFSCTAQAPKNHGPMSFSHSGLSIACDCPFWYPREQFRNPSAVQHRPLPGPSHTCSRYQMRIVAPPHPNPVSYTHLDVYKRQALGASVRSMGQFRRLCLATLIPTLFRIATKTANF